MIVSAFAGRLIAQPEMVWSQTYGEGQFSSVIQTDDGGFALIGHASDNSFYLVRTDGDGDELWSQTFDDEACNFCYSGIQTNDGGFVLAGSIKPEEGFVEALVFKMDEEGELLWSRIYSCDGWDEFHDVIQTEDGGLALAGYTGSRSYWLVLTDDEGEEIWSQTYYGEGRDKCYSVIQTTDGGFALAGKTAQDDIDFLLIRTDENGEELWSQTYGDESSDYCYSAIQTSDGGFALAGESNSRYFRLVRTDEGGEELWTQTYHGGGQSICYSVIQTSDSGFALAGKSGHQNGGADSWLVRTDENGDSLWSQTYGGEETDYSRSVIKTADGGFALAGTTSSYDEDQGRAWLIKTESDPTSVPRIIDPELPNEFAIADIYPNPFNSTSTIEYSLPFTSEVILSLHDLSGQRVETLVNRRLHAGVYRATLDAGDMASGLYFVKLEGSKQVLSRKILLVK